MPIRIVFVFNACRRCADWFTTTAISPWSIPRPSFDAVIVPEDTQNLSATIEKLEKVLNHDHIAEKLEDAEDQGRPDFEPVTVDERLDWPQVVALETHQLELPGVSLQVNPRRHYIYDSLAAHLLGYVGEVTVRDLNRLPDYRMGDEIGKFGLERSLENTLHGDSGGQEIEVDSVGRRLRLLREIPEKPGNSVVMTIDLELQRAAEQAIGNRAGALVAIDPNTGYILAMASYPAFDPNLFRRRNHRRKLAGAGNGSEPSAGKSYDSGRVPAGIDFQDRRCDRGSRGSHADQRHLVLLPGRNLFRRPRVSMLA